MNTSDTNSDAFATPQPGGAGNTDMQGNLVPSRVYGPIQPAQPQPAQQAQPPQQDTNALLAQLLAALGQQSPQSPQPGQAQSVEVSPEDQRLLAALAGIHTSGRDTKVVKRTTIGGGLYFVKYSYSPATGVPTTTHALVFDDGATAHVFGGM